MSQPVETLLWNESAERSCLGAPLLDSSSFQVLQGFLQPSDFALERHRWIFQAEQSLFEHSEPIDNISLSVKLGDRLSQVGGDSYLTALVSEIVTVSSIKHHAAIVRGLANKRRLLNAATKIAEIAVNQKLDDSQAYAEAQSCLMLQSPKQKQEIQPIENLIGNAIVNFRLRVDDPSSIVGMPTGFSNVDNQLHGLKTGLHVWGGVRSSGKTTIMLNVARAAALHCRQRIALFTLEMTEEQLTHRLMAMESGISTDAIETGYLDGRHFLKNEIERVEIASEQLANLCLWIVYAGGWTAGEIRSAITKLKWEHDITGAFVDYLQLLNHKGLKDVEALGDETREFKMCADELDIPVIALSQLHRGIENRECHTPSLSDFRGSGEIEENADVAMGFVFEDAYHFFDPAGTNYKPTDTIDGSVLKDKLGGSVGRSLKFKFNRKTTLLEPLEG